MIFNTLLNTLLTLLTFTTPSLALPATTSTSNRDATMLDIAAIDAMLESRSSQDVFQLYCTGGTAGTCASDPYDAKCDGNGGFYANVAGDGRHCTSAQCWCIGNRSWEVAE